VLRETDAPRATPAREIAKTPMISRKIFFVFPARVLRAFRKSRSALGVTFSPIGI
jgi:hypothetical protein